MTSQEKNVIFVHNFKKNGNHINNIGDIYSALYKIKEGKLKKSFDTFCLHDDIKINGETMKRIQNKTIIIGGGGLIDLKDEWNKKINFLIDNSRQVIFLGCGLNKESNKSDLKEFIKFNSPKVKLIGLRDRNTKHTFVPCPSCLLLTKYEKRENIREFGVVMHCARKMNVNFEFPSIKMTYQKGCNSIEKVLDFISTTEKLVVNSYHAYYWATLLGKKVILLDNWSTKFNNIFPHKPQFYTPTTSIEDQFKESKSYNLLSNYIDVIQTFLSKINKFIDII